METHYWLAGHLGNPGFLNAVIQAVVVGGRERSRLGQKRLGGEMRLGSVSDQSERGERSRRGFRRVCLENHSPGVEEGQVRRGT